MADTDDLDLLAASLRADAGDLEAFVEALAVKLEAALPDQVEVERRGGLLGGASACAASRSRSATSATRPSPSAGA